MTLTSILSATVALAAVLAAIVIGGRVARLTGYVRRRAPTAGRLSLVETLNLDPRRRLLLVNCDGRLVLLLAGQQDQVVGWLPEAAS